MNTNQFHRKPLLVLACLLIIYLLITSSSGASWNMSEEQRIESLRSSLTTLFHSAEITWSQLFAADDTVVFVKINGLPRVDAPDFTKPDWKYVAGSVTIYLFCRPDNGQLYLGWQSFNFKDASTWDNCSFPSKDEIQRMWNKLMKKAREHFQNDPVWQDLQEADKLFH